MLLMRMRKATNGMIGRGLVLAVCLTAGAALAYVMPASSILRRMVDRRETLKLNSLAVTGTAVFPRVSASEAAAALGTSTDRELQTDARFLLRFPGRCRLELSTPEGGQLAAVSAHGKARQEGKALAAAQQALSQVCPLLAIRAAAEGEARAGVERHLSAIGITDRQTALARLDGKVVYVVGAKNPQAQLWIYKDSFQPARVLFKDAQGTAWDVRMKDFGSAVAGDWFPRVVEVRRGEDTVMRFTALDADPKAELADKLF